MSPAYSNELPATKLQQRLLLNRRSAIKAVALLFGTGFSALASPDESQSAGDPQKNRRVPQETADRPDVASRIRGLVIGGVLGDAIGGPVEFQSGEKVEAVLPGTRMWHADRRLTETERTHLAETLKLHSYEEFRPEMEPYGQWAVNAPAGTVTDDTRHKMVLIRTLQSAVSKQQFPVRVQDLAQAYVEFTPMRGIQPKGELAKMNDEGFREYLLAAHWVLGEQEPEIAKPLDRLWSGVSNCSGQMMLTPLAAAFPGKPEMAYRAAYAIDFVDAPGAKDIACSIVAGLAAVLGDEATVLPESDRWMLLLKTMRETDPYNYSGVPFTGRPLIQWMDRAKEFASSADGKPANLFRKLEKDGRPVYWWDAHFTLLVPLAMLHFCEFNALAALHLTLDFGHDTDSYAQVLAALAGAVVGESVFPAEMRTTVRNRMMLDYGEDLDLWYATLNSCAKFQDANGNLVTEVAPQ